MTNQRAIILLSQMYLPNFDDEEIDALTKAIESLTEQEPRVLTLDEVCACSPHSEWLWVEENAYGSVLKSAMICAQIYCFENGFLVFDIPSEYHHASIDLSYDIYGMIWRCWSAKPTEEQRRAVPWTE